MLYAQNENSLYKYNLAGKSENAQWKRREDYEGAPSKWLHHEVRQQCLNAVEEIVE